MIPQKLSHGDSYKRLYDLWNGLVDHLRESRLVEGAGIRLNRSAAGTVISAAGAAQNVASAFAGVVIVRNGTGRDWPIYSALYLSDLAILPEEESPDAYYYQDIMFEASNRPDPWVPGNSKVCILQEPLPAGGIARAMVLGVTHGKVRIKDPDHCFAKPTSGGRLVSAETGPVQIIWQAGVESGDEQQCVLLILGGVADYPESSSGSSESAPSSGSSEPSSGSSEPSSGSSEPSSGSSESEPSSGSSEEPSSGSSEEPSSEEPSSGSSEEPSSEEPSSGSSEEPEPSEPSFSDSYSISGSSSGEPLDCSDYMTNVGPNGQTLYMTGKYSVDHYDCTGDLMYTEIIIFTGWYCHFAGIDYWGGEPEYWEDEEEDTIWNNTSFAVDVSSCRTDQESGRDYIEAMFHVRGGWGPSGPAKRIYTYGKHELEWYEIDDEDDCYYDEEYEEWVGEGRSVVTSLPRAFVFVKPRSEQE